MSALDTLQALQSALLKTKVQKPAPGFKTVAQWCALWGRSNAQVSRTIREAVAAGLWEEQPYVVVSGKVTRPVPHYRPKNRKK